MLRRCVCPVGGPTLDCRANSNQIFGPFVTQFTPDWPMDDGGGPDKRAILHLYPGFRINTAQLKLKSLNKLATLINRRIWPVPRCTGIIARASAEHGCQSQHRWRPPVADEMEAGPIGPLQQCMPSGVPWTAQYSVRAVQLVKSSATAIQRSLGSDRADIRQAAFLVQFTSSAGSPGQSRPQSALWLELIPYHAKQHDDVGR
ncbi:hypothetical protein BX600DRAFT_320358 [Xylariales sp. PMI_506]|nr:hypothetical protein BX600DRAFT_320358 [Xylariales sp. PMI_506]